MPPAVENAIYGQGKPAWHGMGKVLAGAVTVADMEREVVELAAKVEQRPLYAPPVGAAPEPDASWAGALKAEGFHANVRTNRDMDGNPLALPEKVLGVVSGRYAIYQTRQMASMLEGVLAAGELELESAISLRGGSVVVLLARMPEQLTIVGDPIDPYCLLVNSFDASYALTWAMTPVRVECQNLLNVALTGARRVIRIRHTASMEGRTAEIRRALGLTAQYLAGAEKLGQAFAKTKMSEAEGRKFLERLVPLPNVKPLPEAGGSTRALDNALELRTIIERIHNEAPDLELYRGTAWGWQQAVTDYWDHARPTKSAEARLERVALSDAAGLPHRAQRILGELVPVSA